MHLLIFGYGFIGAALARRMIAKGWSASATSRDPAKTQAMAAQGVSRIDPADEAALTAAAGRASAILVAAPPDQAGCPGLRALAPALARANAFPDWIGYLSTTGVYGDREGGWCFETTPLAARSIEGARRVGAERDWRQLGRGMGLTVTSFRLPGLYGLERSPFDKLREGRARRIAKPGHVVGRVHGDDVASALEASIARPVAAGIYNITDDEPAPPEAVTAHAARLIGLEPPPLEPWHEGLLPGPAARFYAESRRISNARAKAELGWRPAYPTYREGLAAVLAAGG